MGRSGTTPTGHARFLDRAYRLKLVNRILDYYGCKAEDWAGGQYVVHSRRGQTELVDYLPQIWMTVEAVAKKPTDPLDADLLATLRTSMPVAHE